ncbi:transglutaminase domain-containing protein, partial [Parabacteroides distasonis]
SSMPLDGLDPETEYGIVFTPLRMVGNIETSMGTYDLALKTAAIPTANEEIPIAKATTVWGKDGRLSVHLASPSKVYISAFDGRLLQAVALPVGDTSLALSAGRYIIRVGNEVFKVAL